MSLMFNVLFAWKCTSTHHKLALDALRHLGGDDAEHWRNLFLKHFEKYLEGSKAPDDRFKDFKNHVLHVRENYWGGATAAARQWYDRTVQQLRQPDWAEAVFSAGVLSHYFSDPFQPLHTGQCEAEGKVHRACEWSIAKAYGELQNILVEDLGGYPEVEMPAGPDWLAAMIKAGATAARKHYDTLIDHYDLVKGVKDPPAGLDQQIKDCVAEQIGLAVSGLALVLRRALDESEARPPKTSVSLYGALNALTVPIYAVTRNLADRRERAVVEAIYDELQKTGRVAGALPPDEQEVRRLYAEEVLKQPLEALDAQEPRAPGTKHGEGAEARPRSTRLVTTQSRPTASEQPVTAGKADEPSRPAQAVAAQSSQQRTPRFYLELTQAIEDAPSIGSKMARRLDAIGVRRVSDLLELDPTEGTQELDLHYVTPETIRQWQAEATLMLRVPGLQGHDAQLIVGCGIDTVDDLATTDAEELLTLVEALAPTVEGQRILRSTPPPDQAEVAQWIAWAADARKLRAA